MRRGLASEGRRGDVRGIGHGGYISFGYFGQLGAKDRNVGHLDVNREVRFGISPYLRPIVFLFPSCPFRNVMPCFDAVVRESCLSAPEIGAWEFRMSQVSGSSLCPLLAE